MSDVEVRPSKKRKLSSAGREEDFNEMPELNLNLVKDAENSNNPSESEDEAEENYQARIDPEDQGEKKSKISKNQLKKLKRREQWEAAKDDRRAKRREKHREKQARKAEQRVIDQGKVITGEREARPIVPKEAPGKRPRRPIPVPVSFILDCDFEEFMMGKELISLGAQLTRCYSDNKSNPYRAHLAISSWNGKLKERFETVLTGNHFGWKGVKFLGTDFVSAAEALDGVMRGKEGGKLVGALAGDVTPPVDSKTVDRPVDGPIPEGKTPALESDDRFLEKPFQEGEILAPEPDFTKSKNENLSVNERIPEGETPATAPETEPIERLTSSNPEYNPNGKDQDAKTEETLPSGETLNPKPRIVYLTSDSEHTLSRLEPNTSYIIGGIVDKNRHKGLCYKRACERGIATAKLPIGEYMTMQSRSVLAVNHVVEIMLKWLEAGDWGEAFLKVIPKRKEAKLRVKGEEGKGSFDGEEDGEKVDSDEDYANGIE